MKSYIDRKNNFLMVLDMIGLILLKQLLKKEVTDDQFENSSSVFKLNTPLSKEEYYYRKMFNEFFPSNSAALTVPSKPSVACSSRDCS